MAELVLSMVTHVISKTLFVTLRESIVRQPGARTLELEQSRIRYLYGDRVPDEEPLNICLLGEAFLQLLATGFGFLASVWATVVLLGGFATILDKMDFWFATVIVFIESARILGFNPHPEAKFFSEVPQAFMDLYIKPLRKTDSTRSATGRNGFMSTIVFLSKAVDFVGNIALAALLIAIAPVVAALTCASLSVVRLASIIGQDYADASKDTTKAKANVKPALVFFYSLVLAQFLFLLMHLPQWNYRRQFAKSLGKKCGFEAERRQLIDKYIVHTLDTCIQSGVANTVKRNLVSFAQDLLKNESDDGHITAVHVLYTLMEQDVHRVRAISQIQSSEQCVVRLFGMLSSNSLVDNKTKACTAAVVAKLVSNMKLDDIPGAIPSIESLLHPCFVKTVTPASSVLHNPMAAGGGNQGQQGANQNPAAPGDDNQGQQGANQNRIAADGANQGAESKPLIAHGLLILGEFACDPVNCINIGGNDGLISKIIAPLHNGMHLARRGDSKSTEIIKEALGVLAKLLGGANDEANGILRGKILGNDLSIKDKLVNIIGYEQESENSLIDIIASLVQEEASRGNFQNMGGFVNNLLSLCFAITDANRKEMRRKIVKKLKPLFLSGNNIDQAAVPAGQALIALARDTDYSRIIMEEAAVVPEPTFIQRLSTMLGTITHVKYRTVIAQMLAHFCAMSSTPQQQVMLEPLRSKFTMVLRVVVNEAEPADVQVQVDPGQNQGLPARNGAGLLETIMQFGPDWFKHALDRMSQAAQMEQEPNERNLLVAFLTLALQMITQTLFPIADPLDRMDHSKFVKKLKKIAELNKESTPDCLDIIKATARLSIWAMENVPETVEYFQEEEIVKVLEKAAKAIRELEQCMLLTGSVTFTATYETLPSLVGRVAAAIQGNN